MSEKSVELVRDMYRQGDPNRFFDLLDDEVVVDMSGTVLLPDHPGVIRGKRDVVDFFRHYWGTWDEYALEATEVLGVGENRVIAVHHERGRGKGSGAPFERQWSSLYTVRAGKLARWTTHANREDALAAASVPE
jgi:ketosteroid isomerase-like protein